ncbi:MAG TPA: type III pantothenate kinase [Burkholderiaceae bacterium]|nr:type III pantothenate kinase [Burkholderiaceae bacterium]
MTLLLDVGNSAIKWAELRDDGTLEHAQWQLHRSVADVASQLIDRWRGVTPGAAVVACNVAGADMVAAVESVVHTLALGRLHWLRAQRRFDGPISLVNGYRDPLQLGADRWHCMLGACSFAARPFVVVNAGTATTVDCVDTNGTDEARFIGRFVGGVIAPGVRLMLESLARETAGLLAAGGAAAAFPDNTDAAIVTGVLDAQAGLVQQVWHRFAARLATPPRLVLTGGNAPAILARLSIEGAAIEHNLVLRGLALRAQFDLSET